MNARRLGLLIVAVLVLGALALMLSRPDSGEGESGELLLPALAGKLNDIDQVTVTGPGDDVIATLVRGDGGWQVAERGYPANLGRVRKNLIALSQARIRETKTANPEFYDRLGLLDIANDEATGLQLELRAGEEQFAVLIGDTGVGGGNGAYVRIPGQARSYLVDAGFDLGKSLKQWLDAEVMDIGSDEVRSVRIEHPDGDVILLSKSSPDATQFSVDNIPEGRTLTFPSVGNSIGAALASLELDDVQPAADFSPSATPTVARFETFDGLVVEAQTWRVDDGHRVAFRASVAGADQAGIAGNGANGDSEAPVASPTAAGVQNEAGLADGSDDEAGLDAGQAEGEASTAADDATQPAPTAEDRAAAINGRVIGWVFQLPDFKTDQFIKRMSDLLAAE
jgi:hypothetical protein